MTGRQRCITKYAENGAPKADLLIVRQCGSLSFGSGSVPISVVLGSFLSVWRRLGRPSLGAGMILSNDIQDNHPAIPPLDLRLFT